MNDINDIVNGKTGHDTVNDIEQLSISQKAYLLAELFLKSFACTLRMASGRDFVRLCCWYRVSLKDCEWHNTGNWNKIL